MKIFNLTFALLLILSPLFGSNTQIEFPNNWVNSAPFKMDQLKGKLVVLYFYEEGWPTCRRDWVGLMKISNKYKGQPVFFFAVNSGNPASEVQSYVNSVKLDWPTIVDTSRSFEKACNVPEVNFSRDMSPSFRIMVKAEIYMVLANHYWSVLVRLKKIHTSSMSSSRKSYAGGFLTFVCRSFRSYG